jgi:hypothetical protein
MGIQPLHTIEEYWNTQPEKGGIFKPVRDAMSLKRYQQLKRYFYCFPNQPNPPSGTQPKLRPWEKVKTIANHLRQLFMTYWLAGRNLAIDEAMIGFLGRAKEIVHIPTKPTPTGYKVWAMADKGYTLNWLWHAPGEKTEDGPQGISPHLRKLGVNRTQQAVIQLLSTLPNHGKGHLVWLDNLFSSGRLFEILANQGIGAAGTVRCTKTKEEKKAEAALGIEEESEWVCTY